MQGRQCDLVFWGGRHLVQEFAHTREHVVRFAAQSVAPAGVEDRMQLQMLMTTMRSHPESPLQRYGTELRVCIATVHAMQENQRFTDTRTAGSWVAELVRSVCAALRHGDPHGPVRLMFVDVGAALTPLLLELTNVMQMHVCKAASGPLLDQGSDVEGTAIVLLGPHARLGGPPNVCEAHVGGGADDVGQPTSFDTYLRASHFVLPGGGAIPTLYIGKGERQAASERMRQEKRRRITQKRHYGTFRSSMA